MPNARATVSVPNIVPRCSGRFLDASGLLWSGCVAGPEARRPRPRVIPACGTSRPVPTRHRRRKRRRAGVEVWGGIRALHGNSIGGQTGAAEVVWRRWSPRTERRRVVRRCLRRRRRSGRAEAQTESNPRLLRLPTCSNTAPAAKAEACCHILMNWMNHQERPRCAPWERLQC